MKVSGLSTRLQKMSCQWLLETVLVKCKVLWIIFHYRRIDSIPIGASLGAVVFF